MKLLLLILIILYSSACITAQDNSTQQKSDSAPTAVSQTNSSSSSDGLSQRLQTKLLNRASHRLDLSQMKKVQLAVQPQNIVKTIHFFETDDNLESLTPANYAKNKEIYVLDMDLNNDGVMEKIVYDNRLQKSVEDSTALPYLCIFKLENNLWKFLHVINGNITTDENATEKQKISVEFLSSGKKADFDIIKITELSSAADEKTKTSKSVCYFIFKKGGFDDEILYPQMKEVYSADSYIEIQ